MPFPACEQSTTHCFGTFWGIESFDSFKAVKNRARKILARDL